MFKRRDKQGFVARLRAQWRRPGGAMRAGKYLWHRLRRLPDPPERIARGVFAGVFVTFLPIIGIHFIAAAIVAWFLRGNILAALLATLVGNPVTFPLIALAAMSTGHWILGTTDPLTIPMVFDAFGAAAGDLWHNFFALIGGPGQPHWAGLILFWRDVYLPYLVGSIAPGLFFSLAAAGLTIPVVRAYQAMRQRRRLARVSARAMADVVAGTVTVTSTGAKGDDAAAHSS